MSAASTKSPPDLFQAATAYVNRGYAVVPVYPRSKKPIGEQWQTRRMTPDQISVEFKGNRNIGILLGSASGGLTDVDLDCPEAVELAPQYLPHTPVKTGRVSRPQSHWWYVTSGVKNTKHKDPVTGGCIVELSGDGRHTVVGPSIHESGERIDILEGEPAVVDAADLAAAVAALHAAVSSDR
jgi:hypothetical protein